MDQETRWLTRYNEVKTFIKENHRNPSKHRIEEHDMLNWLKANRKLTNADALKEPRLSKFKELLALVEKNKRKNGSLGIFRGFRLLVRYPSSVYSCQSEQEEL